LNFAAITLNICLKPGLASETGPGIMAGTCLDGEVYALSVSYVAVVVDQHPPPPSRH